MTEWKGDMEEVAAICGDEVARAICDTLPGILLYVPKKPRANNPINRLSEGIAATLIAQFGGDTIYVPSKRRTKDETYQMIEALVDKGLTTQQIALKLGITQGYIFQSRREAGAPRIANKPDPRQIPLFK